MQIVPLSEDRFAHFVRLICELAEYEHLPPPTAEAQQRLYNDAFLSTPRYEAFLAIDGNSEAVGYAIVFETYSSFLAKPTLYLEDIFVRASCRTMGAGGMLFEHITQLAQQRGCGRVDWQVLDWNTLAREFYARRGATHEKEWLLYRITLPE